MLDKLLKTSLVLSFIHHVSNISRVRRLIDSSLVVRFAVVPANPPVGSGQGTIIEKYDDLYCTLEFGGGLVTFGTWRRANGKSYVTKSSFIHSVDLCALALTVNTITACWRMVICSAKLS